MNDQGDVFRVATNVVKRDGPRAGRTHIEAINHDGNPNDVWTYGWMDTGFQTFTPFTLYSNGLWPGWYGWADCTPHVAINDTGSIANAVQPGQFALHPGNGNQPAIVRWTAPADVLGEASIVGSSCRR